MAKLKVRYLLTKKGVRGGVRRYWNPSTKMLSAGWRLVTLPEEQGAAVAAAEAINAALDAWRRDPAAPVQVAPEHLPLALAAAPAGVIKGDNRRADGKKVRTAIPPGSLSALCDAYRKSEDVPTKANTRRSYEDNLRTLMAWDERAGYPPLDMIGPKDLKTFWRELTKRAPTKANQVLGMARIVFNWAIREEKYAGYLVTAPGGASVRVPENPAANLQLKQVKVQRGEDDLWTDEEVEIFSAVAEHMGYYSIGTAVELNAWCGQRQGDVLALRRTAYRDGTLTLTQSKTGAAVSLPIDLVPGLPERLKEQTKRNRAAGKAAAPANDNVETVSPFLILCEATGQPWKADHFRHVFANIRAEAARWCPSLANKQFLLLRHTAVVRLSEAGCEMPEIASITGHTLASVNNILSRYHVRTKRQAESAFRKRLLASLPGQSG